jgi:hypothetical protein
VGELRHTVAVAAIAAIALGTVLVGFVCPWTRGAEGRLDDRNYPSLRGLKRLPKKREEWEAFAWYGGWSLILLGSLTQLVITI